MARMYEMTWVPGRKRWTKKYKGRMYVISPKALDVPATKADSYQAANVWWLKKQAEIDEASKPVLDQPSAAVKQILERTPVSELYQLIEQGQAAQKVLSLLEAASLHGKEPPHFLPGCTKGVGPIPCPEGVADDLAGGRSIPTECIDTVLSGGVMTSMKDEWRQEELRRAERRIKPNEPYIDPDRTVGGQVRAWIKLQHAQHLAGKISAGRFDAYKRNIGAFQDWIGAEHVITCITASKIEEFFAHLCIQIGQKRYAPSYAKNLFGAAKNFVRRLAELDLIPLPGNLLSRRFGFGDSSGEIVTFTVEEVRALLAGCDGFSSRTKLYLLLALNCGMYQNDISELRQSELCLEEGTIKRKRSKSRKRKNAPTVTYKLWPETLALLRERKSDHPERVLLTEDGNPLVKYGADGGDLERYDVIQSAYSRLYDRVKIDKPFKSLRKTSATLLDGHETYGRYAQYFLGQAPRSVAERSYVVPSGEQFFRALEWLREQLLGVKAEGRGARNGRVGSRSADRR